MDYAAAVAAILSIINQDTTLTHVTDATRTRSVELVITITTSLQTTWLLPMSVHRYRREPNLYGFIFSSPGKSAPWAGIQLQTLLNLSNDKFQVLKRNILNLMRKHMDMQLKGTEQPDRLRAIENELKELHPEMFATEESKKRLYFATRLVLQVHASHRYKLRKRNEAAPTQSSPIITHNQRTNRQSEVTTQNLAPESASRTLPRSKESTIHDPNQYRDVRSFLETSMPPMTHLTDAFIDFGCVNAEFLLTISSWTFERIRDVLDQLSAGPDGRQITEMDKFILQNHFKEYFTQLGKKGNST